MRQLYLNVNFIDNIDDSRIFKFTLNNLVSENRVWFARSIKKKITFVKNRPKNDICYPNFKIFFSKKNFLLEIV